MTLLLCFPLTWALFVFCVRIGLNLATNKENERTNNLLGKNYILQSVKVKHYGMFTIYTSRLNHEPKNRPTKEMKKCWAK